MQFLHAKEKRSKKQLRFHGFQIALGCGIYWLVISLIPIYNKVLFNGLGEDKGFPYPLTTTCIQLATSCLLVFIFCLLTDIFQNDKALFFELAVKKCKRTIFVGFLFGIKLGITNWGLKLIPVGPHLLLQSTDIMWTVLFAHLRNNEILSRSELFLSILTVIGSIMIALHTDTFLSRSGSTNHPIFAILINIASPIFLGLVVSQLKKTVHNFHEICPCDFYLAHLTVYKLFFSTLTLIPFALAFESSAIQKDDLGSREKLMLIYLAAGGGFLTAIFQVNMTWLSSLTSVVSLAIVGGFKVVPQWLLATILFQSFDMTFLNLCGGFLLLSATVLWTRSRYKKYLKEDEVDLAQASFISYGSFDEDKSLLSEQKVLH
eukprot:maker-scaffold_15-snap-gene-10.73-mRNA-1 protein AED:0.01 eAED:0.01 QI:21/1/1/1/1/1/5/510/374